MCVYMYIYMYIYIYIYIYEDVNSDKMIDRPDLHACNYAKAWSVKRAYST